MDNDRELLEMAAKAAGLQNHVWSEQGYGMVNYFGGEPAWNPLRDDGDALRLAVRLSISVEFDRFTACAHAKYGSNSWKWEAAECVRKIGRLAATRRAIVRAAAAAIGRATP